jgi:hypothetical protein
MEWEMRKGPARTNTWTPATVATPNSTVWPPPLGRASAPPGFLVPFQLPVQVLPPSAKPEEKTPEKADSTKPDRTDKTVKDPKKAKGEGKTKVTRVEQKTGTTVPRPSITRSSVEREEGAGDAKSREIAFAKVMQHLDPFETDKGSSTAPKKPPSQVMNMLLQPEQDVQEVLRAPAAMIERRLWEKLYNRALFSGCTHRQALSVTERVLKKGQAEAIKILASPALMEEESKRVVEATVSKEAS